MSLSPLSYNTMRSHVFNGTQPSNEGCTNGVSTDGQTIDCGQGTTLIDCDRGYIDTADYSDLSNYFIWNRTTSVAQVSIEFTFDQPVNISRISMFFWCSHENNIIVPNVRMYWADHTMQFNEIDIATNLPNGTKDGQLALNISITDRRRLKYQSLRVEMMSNSEWTFLGEVQFCGKHSQQLIIVT